MPTLGRSPQADTRLKWVFAALSAGWLAMVGLSFFLWERTERRNVGAIARAEGRTAFAKDRLFRRWATMHGGIYVPATPSTPPNPHLAHLPDRDLTAPDGRALTLMNPAYMMRQIYEMAGPDRALVGHITSLKVLRPANAPDAWEAAALRAFEEGKTEVSAQVILDGQPYLRQMQPLVAEAGCLKCHGHQGYRVGEIRGGIGVTVPLAPLLAATRAERSGQIVAHGLFALGGVSGLWVAFALVVRRTRKRDEAVAALRESEERHRALFQDSPVCIWEEDLSEAKRRLDPWLKAGPAALAAHVAAHPQFVRDCAPAIRVIEANRVSLELFGVKSAKELRGSLAAYFIDESWPIFTRGLLGLAEGQKRIETELPIRLPTGEVRTLAVRVVVPAIGDEGLSRILVSFLDITEQKHGEERIREQLAELQRWQAVMLDREDRVLRLKREVNALNRRLGEPPEYPSQAAERRAGR